MLYKNIAAESWRSFWRLTTLFVVIRASLPTPAIAQLDGVLRNLLQNIAPQPAPSPVYRPQQNYYQPPEPYYPQSQPPLSAPPRASVRPDPQSPSRSDELSPEAVVALQSQLDKLGYDPGPIDGAWGARSVQAVRNFQRDHGLRATGQTDPKTLLAIRVAAATQRQPEQTTTNGATWLSPRPNLPQRTAETDNIATKSDSREMSGALDCINSKVGMEAFTCRSNDLLVLDRQMAAAYAMAAARTAPARLVSEQRAWVQTRDACPPAGSACLQDLYRARIAELSLSAASDPAPLPSDAVARSSVAAAREWGLPLLDGLPYSPPWEQVRSQNSRRSFSAGDDTVQAPLYTSMPFTSLRYESSATRAWTRSLIAMGLRASDVTRSNLPENLLIKLACTFLDEDQQRKITGGPDCSGLDVNRSKPGSEFVTHDFAAEFANKTLPEIMKNAPALPFRFYVAIPARLSQYNLASGNFAVSAINTEHLVKAFGSPTNTSLTGLTWPLAQAEARAFSQRYSADQSLFFRVELTVTGTITTSKVPEGSSIGDFTGLPNYMSWRIEGGQVALYSGPKLQEKLYVFPDPSKRPLPIIGTPQASVPQAKGRVSLNSDGVLVTLLHTGALTADQIDWSRAAVERFTLESQVDQKEPPDPWGKFFGFSPEGEAQSIASFRDWTIRRAHSFTGLVALRSMIPSARADQISLFGDGHASLSSNPQQSEAVSKRLAELGLNDTNLLPLPYRVGSIGRKLLFTALPEASTSYELPYTGPKPYSMDIEFSVKNGEALSSEAMLLQLIPTSVTLRSTDKVIASLSVPPPKPFVRVSPSPDTSRPPVTIRSALERVAAGPYGPDIVGLRLGMTSTEADHLIRNVISVGRTAQPARPTTGSTDLPSWLSGRIYISQDRRESIAIFSGSSSFSDRVVGIWRQTMLSAEPGMIKQLKDALRVKYGASISESPYGWAFWSDQPKEASRCWTGKELTWSTWADSGQRIGLGLESIGVLPTLLMPYPEAGSSDRSSYKACGATLKVLIGTGSLSYGGVAEIPISTSIFDMGVMTELRDAPGQPEPARPPLPMKL